MMAVLSSAALVGASTSQSGVLAVLTAFVAINTVMYAALAVAKMLPKVRVPRRFRRSYARSETRNVHPLLGWDRGGEIREVGGSATEPR